MEIKVGNIIKSEDFEQFEGREACYKIGVVTAVERNRLVFQVLVDVYEGRALTTSRLIGSEMAITLPGLSRLDWPTRIQILS